MCEACIVLGFDILLTRLLLIATISQQKHHTIARCSHSQAIDSWIEGLDGIATIDMQHLNMIEPELRHSHIEIHHVFLF